MEEKAMNTARINAAISTATGITRDFASDLNAMHEAEKALSPEQAWNFVNELGHAADARGWLDSISATFKLAHSTADQRAEAFLRTIGKWTDA